MEKKTSKDTRITSLVTRSVFSGNFPPENSTYAKRHVSCKNEKPMQMGQKAVAIHLRKVEISMRKLGFGFANAYVGGAKKISYSFAFSRIFVVC